MIKVYRMNDYDWVAASSLEEAIKWYAEDCELPEDEACDDPYELTEHSLKEHTFYEEWPEKDHPITFYDRLNNIVSEGCKFPCLFASTEY